VFASSAFVPVNSMPGWLQAFAKNQPVSVAIDAVRSLVLGSVSHGVVNHSHRPVLVIPSQGDSSDTPRGD